MLYCSVHPSASVYPPIRPAFQDVFLFLTSVFPRALASMRRSLNSSGLCPPPASVYIYCTPFSFSNPPPPPHSAQPVRMYSFSHLCISQSFGLHEMQPPLLRAVSSPASVYTVPLLASVYPPPCTQSFRVYSYSHLCISQSFGLHEAQPPLFRAVSSPGLSVH